MAKVSLNNIKNWFKTGFKPTQAQFWDTWDSFWHKDDQLSTHSVEGLDDLLAEKADNQLVQAHLTDPNAHGIQNKVDKIAGKSLSTEDYTTAEKEKLAGLQNYDDAHIYSELAGKLTKPTEPNNTADYVVLGDGGTKALEELGGLNLKPQALTNPPLPNTLERDLKGELWNTNAKGERRAVKVNNFPQTLLVSFPWELLISTNTPSPGGTARNASGNPLYAPGEKVELKANKLVSAIQRALNDPYICSHTALAECAVQVQLSNFKDGDRVQFVYRARNKEGISTSNTYTFLDYTHQGSALNKRTKTLKFNIPGLYKKPFQGSTQIYQDYCQVYGYLEQNNDVEGIASFDLGGLYGMGAFYLIYENTASSNSDDLMLQLNNQLIKIYKK